MKFSNYAEFLSKFEVEHDNVKILSARKIYRRFPWKIVKVSMIPQFWWAGPPIKIWGGELWLARSGLLCKFAWFAEKWRSLTNWLAGWLASLQALLAQIAWLSNFLNWLFAWLLALLCFDLTMRSYWLGSTCFACAHACSLSFGLPFFSGSDSLTSPLLFS